jgi:quinol monooxygenase YgiN
MHFLSLLVLILTLTGIDSFRCFTRHATSSTSFLTMSKKYCLNVILYPNPARREEFIACIKNNQQNTLDKDKEPKALVYTFGESTSEPNVFHFQEVYEDEDGFKHHTKTPHFAAWEEFASSENAFVKDPVIHFFEAM